jgi:ferric-dicitrate binding protein FerR (iron transport regulator)
MAEPEDDVPPEGNDYLWDKSGAPDPEVARLEAVLAPLAHDGAPLRLPAGAGAGVVPIGAARKRRRWAIAGAALAAAAAAAVAIVVLRPPAAPRGCEGGEGFAFAADQAVACGAGRGTSGTLAVGGWIETADGIAQVQVATIGTVELKPDSRLALRGTSPAEHRLALERGRLHARVTAPPRLFVIETPSATAIDLGCEYDLAVAPDGTGTLDVITGQVELAGAGGALVVVPAATGATFTARGVGLPVRKEATPVLRAAVAAFDPADPMTVDAVLAAAGPGDQITLVNLLALAAPYQRAAIHDALFELSPTPEDVLRDAIIAGDGTALARWRESVVDGWMISEWCLSPDHAKTDPHSPWRIKKPQRAPPAAPPPDAAPATWDPAAIEASDAAPAPAGGTWGP